MAMMDFDPSDFLAVAMSEDQDAVYTAGHDWNSIGSNLYWRPPDLSQPDSSIHLEEKTITVEGGLQLEQNLQLSVPVFGMLNLVDEEVTENGYEPGTSNENGLLKVDRPKESLSVDLLEQESTTTSLPSPSERTSSPHPTKKLIPTSFDESRFRKDLFCGAYERVKLFRLHCTICDKHLGCAPWITERQMRVHKLLNVAVCRKCFDFYGDINFPTEDGSELYCSWCGQGGDVFCCSKCPRTVCKMCFKRNFEPSKIQEITDNDNWVCFVCDSKDIWPHRALLWGLQRFGREMRQRVALLPKEEKQAKLSNDTSHCCESNQALPLISLPHKRVMAKVPFCLIAAVHQPSVRKQAEQESIPNNNREVLPVRRTIERDMNNIVQHTNRQFYRPEQSAIMVSLPGMPTSSRMSQPNLSTNSMLQQRIMFRGIPNRPVFNTPQMVRERFNPMARPSPIVQPHSSLFNRLSTPPMTQPYIAPEVIDLEDDSPVKQSAGPSHNNIAWLEKLVQEVTQSLMTVNLMVTQFEMLKSELSNDFEKTRSYSEKLSHNIKIAICSLAKVNQDIVDANKVAIDNQVMTVVKNIQLNGLSNTFGINRSQTGSGSVNSNLPPSVSLVPVTEESTTSKTPTTCTPIPKTPERREAVDSTRPTPAITSTTSEDDLEYLPPAVLCETVMEVEGNKENESGNKSKVSPVKRNKSKRSTPFVKVNGRKLISSSKNPHTNNNVIDLSDDEVGSTFDESFYLKKFKIKPCKVVLIRLKLKKK